MTSCCDVMTSWRHAVTSGHHYIIKWRHIMSWRHNMTSHKRQVLMLPSCMTLHCIFWQSDITWHIRLLNCHVTSWCQSVTSWRQSVRSWNQSVTSWRQSVTSHDVIWCHTITDGMIKSHNIVFHWEDWIFTWQLWPLIYDLDHWAHLRHWQGVLPYQIWHPYQTVWPGERS